jgi:hypothetical protein
MIGLATTTDASQGGRSALTESPEPKAQIAERPRGAATYPTEMLMMNPDKLIIEHLSEPDQA